MQDCTHNPMHDVWNMHLSYSLQTQMGVPVPSSASTAFSFLLELAETFTHFFASNIWRTSSLIFYEGYLTSSRSLLNQQCQLQVGVSSSLSERWSVSLVFISYLVADSKVWMDRWLPLASVKQHNGYHSLLWSSTVVAYVRLMCVQKCFLEYLFCEDKAGVDEWLMAV